MIAGLIPGLIGLAYRKYRMKDKTLWTMSNFLIVTSSIVIVSLFVANLNNNFIQEEGADLALGAYAVQMVLTIFLFNGVYMYMKKKKNKYLSSFSLISIFVFITDNIILFLVPIWDSQTLGIPYMPGLILSMTYFAAKMWFNVAFLLIIFIVLDKQISRQVEYSKVDDITKISVKKESSTRVTKTKGSKRKI